MRVRCTCEGCDEAAAHYNVFVAMKNAGADATDMEIEAAILRGWAEGEFGEPNEPQDQTWMSVQQNETVKHNLPPLRDRNGRMPLLHPEKAQALNKIYPSPVWGIKTGFLRRLHQLRHSPSKRMIDFIWAALPIKAKQRKENALIKEFLEILKAFCETIIRRCPGCALNAKKVSRPIGLAVVPAFWLGMLDLVCLDYALRLYALIICDIGTGGSWLFVVSKCPPDGESVFMTYMTRYASIFGCHKKILGIGTVSFLDRPRHLSLRMLGWNEPRRTRSPTINWARRSDA
jgi:hypothetical protein